MQQYRQLVEDVMQNGYDSDDRTGVGTKSVFGRQVRFDLSKGFPLLNLKRTYWKGVVSELIWMLSGSTNAYDLPKEVQHWWTPWSNKDGELGPTYGKQFRKKEHYYWVEPKIFKPKPLVNFNFSDKIEVDYKSGSSVLLGKTFLSKQDGEFTVIKEIPQKKGRSKFIVKFHETYSEIELPYTRVISKSVKDLFKKSVYGVGCYGVYDKNDEDLNMLKNTWRDMLRRCYDKKNKAYKSYGAKGVHVSPRWLVFANFQKDVKEIANWSLKKTYPTEYSIDKDILFASNRYSKETCMWASREEQDLNHGQNRPFKSTDPKGDEKIFISFGQAFRKYGLNIGAIHRCLNKKLKTHKGWSNFKYLEKRNMVLRCTVTDQLKKVISEIKTTPNSRRLNISLWSGSEINFMKLPPCHGNLIQFYVRDGRISCSMYQRSGDLFLGVPVNIAFYSLLTHLIANECGLEVGDFVHTFGDLHIYKNHIDQCKEMLSRKQFTLPTLEINLKPGKLMNWIDNRVQDASWAEITHAIQLKNYKSHPAIKAEVAV